MWPTSLPACRTDSAATHGHKHPLRKFRRVAWAGFGDAVHVPVTSKYCRYRYYEAILICQYQRLGYRQVQTQYKWGGGAL